MYSKRTDREAFEAPLLLPAMLDLTGKTLLFIGGGKAIAAKLRMLEGMRGNSSKLPHVIIVAPEVNAEIRSFVEIWRTAVYHAGFPVSYAPELHEREFQMDDLLGVDLLWCYTDKPLLNQSVARAANARRILASVAGVRGQGGFIQPAVMRSETLPENITISVSTAGNDPRLAVFWRDRIKDFIRRETEHQIPEEL